MGAALYREEGFSGKEAGAETCLGEAEKDTLTTWMRGMQKEYRPRCSEFLDGGVLISPFIPFPPAEVENLKKKKKIPESLAAMILKTN